MRKRMLFSTVVGLVVIGALLLVGCARPAPPHNGKTESIPLVARGMLVSQEAWENLKREYVGFAAINWTNEENYLELTFNSGGGEVTGSFKWVMQVNRTFPGEMLGASGRKTETYTVVHSGTLTGMYMEGTFKGEVTGTVADTADGTAPRSGSLRGTWTGELDGARRIAGQLVYVVRYTPGEWIGQREYEWGFPFTATVQKTEK